MDSVGNGVSYLGDTIEVMDKLINEGVKVDFILTSPPYNMRGHEKTFYNNAKTFRDNMSNEEYRAWLVDIFNHYDQLLTSSGGGGVVLFNINYMSSLKNRAINLMKNLVAIEEQTSFTLIDQIAWKKDGAMPLTEARLSRLFENVFVFIKKDNWENFNKQYKKILVGRYNVIEAPNNDGKNKFNAACFSQSFVSQLLTLYNVQKDSVVLDNFMGTHTTAIGCEEKGCKWIGIEIDEETRRYGLDRVHGYIGEISKITNIDNTKQLNLFNIEEH